jgi:ribosomal protein L34
MKRYEIEPYLGKSVLIYAKRQQICSGQFSRMRTINGNEVMEIRHSSEYSFLAIQDVLYMIETKRS